MQTGGGGDGGDAGRLGSQVQLMTRGGGIVTLPSDCQAAFARYVSRANITSLKRYSVAHVYTERKFVGTFSVARSGR